MNIGLFTDTYYPEVNGVANSVYQLKKELEANGNTVYVFTVSNPMQKEKEEHVYRMRSIPFPLLKERRVSYSLAKRWYPLIQSLRLDVIHTQTEFMVGHIGRKAAEKFHIPLIHTYHTIYEDYTHYLKIPGNQKLKGAVRCFSRICCDRADEVIVPTEKVKKIIQSYGVKKTILVQPTGIALGKFAMTDPGEVARLRDQYGLKPEDHILLSIGRLSQEKNLKEIIHFMKTLSKQDTGAKLVIVGEGPEREKLEETVQAEKLKERVIFTGEAEWKNIQNYYALGDVFVSASTSETQGLTYAEALAAGKPLLVRADECLNGVLNQGVNGYAYRNEEEFCRYYRELFAQTDRSHMARQAMESIRPLSSKTFGRNVEQIYKNLVWQKTKQTTEGHEGYEKIHTVVG